MKCNIKIAVIPNGKDPEQTEVEYDGDLAGAKTYIKLSAGSNFNWAAIQRTDKMKAGDVSRWMINLNHTTKDLICVPFSFYGVDPIINVNTMRAAFDRDPAFMKISTYLGGGAF